MNVGLPKANEKVTFTIYIMYLYPKKGCNEIRKASIPSYLLS